MLNPSHLSSPVLTIRTACSLLLVTLVHMATAAERAEVEEPLPPLVAADSMAVPDGFQVTLFAGEPIVKQPISFCLDDRGRLWVAEAYNYPVRSNEAGDRIIILEDTNGDGEFDKRTLFYDKLNYVSGVEVGFGGVWVMSPPYFYFIPDRDGDDRPDGEPQLLLDGFGDHANAHNMANGFAWGPDGWLYATHGRTNWSMIGKPGAAEADRRRFDGGVWRYHPTRHVWEAYADGTTNPWGIDWNDHGEAFVCNCVNPHLFHVIEGAHYEPWRGRKSSQYAYQRIDTIADHLHFTGGGDVRAGIGSDSEHDAGGGHAHCGTMIYLGDNFPPRYRNSVFMNNIHGRRINNDLLARKGSTYTASHGKDFMLSADPWFMGVTLAYGPGGEVYVSDWSDTGECHSVRNTRRHTGRIYRISYGELTVPRVDLAAMTSAELADLQSHKNDWYVRHARRLLHERFAAGNDLTSVHEQLHKLFKTGDVPRKLRALWALKVTGGLDESFLLSQLEHESEYVRAWSVKLLCEDRQPSKTALDRFELLAANGDSQLVRLHLCSALQRLEFADRWPIAEALAARAEDARDQCLPLMLWYAVEPLIEHDRARLIRLAGSTQIPLVREHIARRVASEQNDNAAGLDALVSELGKIDSQQGRSEMLDGILKGLEGRRRVAVPGMWNATFATLSKSSDDPIAARALASAIRLALIFDDPRAKEQLIATAADRSADERDRTLALNSLVEAKISGMEPLLFELIDDPAMQVAALRGLARYEHRQTAEKIMHALPGLDTAARQAALQTLASRKAWATELLNGVEAGTIERAEINAFTARQLTSLGDSALTARLTRLWGTVRGTPKERAEQIASLRKELSAETLSQANLASGRLVFEKTCGKCHKLFGTGGMIGPDITGAQRHNLDYLLENVLDPSAAVSRDWLTQVIQTTDGRVLSGLIVSETEQAVTIQTIEERIVVPVNEIAARKVSPTSMMPDGILKPLSAGEIRDLFGYLQSPRQVEAPRNESQ